MDVLLHERGDKRAVSDVKMVLGEIAKKTTQILPESLLRIAWRFKCIYRKRG